MPSWEIPVDSTLVDTSPPYTKTEWVDISNQPGEKGREDSQRYWQEWVGQLFSKVRILDVGSGLGLSRERLAVGGNVVELQEPAPDLPGEYKQDISELPDKKWDVVTSFDVIEHVIEDEKFLANLVRLARKYVIFTTPNYSVSHAIWPYHCREYTAEQILKLVEPYRIAQLSAGVSDGSHFYTLRRDFFAKHTSHHHCVILHAD
jgi:2-polyprenyl-3-methyl-5-hydroxy-6-metoxy-1,4-benzoquinol methylase